MEEKTVQQQFIESYDELSDAIFRHCYFRVSNREVALDLMQDAFAKTWRHLQKGNDIYDARAFLYKVTNNLIIDYYRKKKSVSLEYLTENEERPFQPPDNAHEQMLFEAELSEALKMLNKLEEPYRQAVTLRYVDGLSPKEIAEIVGENANNVSVRINRGISKLKKYIN